MCHICVYITILLLSVMLTCLSVYVLFYGYTTITNVYTCIYYTMLYYIGSEREFVATERLHQLHIAYPHIEFISVDFTIPDWHNIILMSICRYIIIANSSFSW